MARDDTGRFETARQEVAHRCLELFERLCPIHGTLPDGVRIEMLAYSTVGTEHRSSKRTSTIQWPNPIPYNRPGRVTGVIEGYQISVSHDGERRFTTRVNGELHTSLRSSFVESQLGIPVRRKRSGNQPGSPSETLAYAVWKHLLDRYNNLDRTVVYDSRGHNVDLS